MSKNTQRRHKVTTPTSTSAMSDLLQIIAGMQGVHLLSGSVRTVNVGGSHTLTTTTTTTTTTSTAAMAAAPSRPARSLPPPPYSAYSACPPAYSARPAVAPVAATPAVPTVNKYKTVPCRFNKTGTCTNKGTACTFIHVSCEAFAKTGSFALGDACPYPHGG